ASQFTCTLVTSALLLTVPVPLTTWHTCRGKAGVPATTATLYTPPSTTGVANSNVPFALTVRSSPPELRNTRPATSSPCTVPPIEYTFTQVMATLVMFAASTVPPALATVQRWRGAVGCVSTLTR